VPVTTTVYTPAAPEQDNAEVPLVVDVLSATVDGDRLQGRPVEGETVAVSEIVPAKPSRPVTVTVEVAVTPAKTGTLIGLAVTAKSWTA
jgi:hypothetical protein